MNTELFWTHFLPVIPNFIPQHDVMFPLYIKTYKGSSYNRVPSVSLTLGLLQLMKGTVRNTEQETEFGRRARELGKDAKEE